jgi:DNA-binding transcriptional MerR regulator
MEKALPAIPAKRYFTIGEVSDLCGVKPYVLRYWEQEFTQLKPMKRRGNRRYYQHHEVLLIRRIRELLYEQGFTISGARNRLSEAPQPRHLEPSPIDGLDVEVTELADGVDGVDAIESLTMDVPAPVAAEPESARTPEATIAQVRQELMSIRGLLTV